MNHCTQDNGPRPATFTRRAGQSIVEFALLLPVVLALIFGIIEYGFFVKNSLTVANAAREGARAAAVGKTTAEIGTRISTQAAPLSVASPGGSITLEVSTNDGTSFSALPADTGGKNAAAVGSLVRVTVTSRHRPLTGFFGSVFQRDLRTRVVMRREGA